MKDYKRLTERTKHGIAVLDSGERFVLSCGGYATTKALNRLAELEDKIENGTLIFIDEPFYSECNNCWAVFQRTDDNVITCRMTEQQAINYKKFRGIENEPL